MCNCGLRRPTLPAKKPLDFENSRGYPSPRDRGTGVLIFLLKKIFFIIPDLVQRPTAAPIAVKKSPLDGTTDFPAKI